MAKWRGVKGYIGVTESNVFTLEKHENSSNLKLIVSSCKQQSKLQKVNDNLVI